MTSGVLSSMPLKRELRVVHPALRIAQCLGDHPGEALVAAERRGVDAVLHLDGVGERLRGALADLRGGAGNDVPRLGAGLGERAALGQDPGGQVGVEGGQPAWRRADDRRATRPDGRRPLDGVVGFGGGSDRAGDGLIQHDTGENRSAPAARRHASRRSRRSGPARSVCATGGADPGWTGAGPSPRRAGRAGRAAARATRCAAPARDRPRGAPGRRSPTQDGTTRVRQTPGAPVPAARAATGA